MFSLYHRRVRHPLFPDLAAKPAARARGKSKALAGTFTELTRAAARGAEAQRAVFVLTREDEFLSDGQRDELWILFQVPVYALRLDGGGRVIAWECEAQNGLHSSGAGGSSDCPCGRRGQRLTHGRPLADAAD